VDFDQTLHQIQTLSKRIRQCSMKGKRASIDSYLPLLMRQTRLADQTRSRFEVVEVAEVAVDSAEG
jgi:hypothetical protein